MSKIAKGQRVAGIITKDASRADKIQDVRETIKCNEYLIHYYELLLNDEPENHLSFQVYLREIDARGEVIKQERRDLIATFDKASNGEIPAIQQQQIGLQEKLKTLRAELSPERQAAKHKKKIDKTVHRTKVLREKLAQLERELKDENFVVEDLLDEIL